MPTFNIIDLYSYAHNAAKSSIPDSLLLKSILEPLRTSIKLNKPSSALVLLPTKEKIRTMLGESFIKPFDQAQKITQELGLTYFECNHPSRVVSSLLEQGFHKKSLIVISTFDVLMTKHVSKNVIVENSHVGDIVTELNIENKIGVKPEHIPSLLAMVGSEMNGVHKTSKVGIRNAVKWISEIGSVDEIFSKKELLQGASAEELVKNELNVINHYNMLKNNDFLPLPAMNTSRRRINSDVLYSHYIDCNLHDWLPEDKRNEASDLSPSPIDVFSAKSITSPGDLADLIFELNLSKSFSLFAEKNPAGDVILLGVSNSDVGGFFIPLTNPLWSQKVLGHEFVFSFLKDILENEKIKKVSSESKELYKIACSHGIELKGLAVDLETLVYTINSRDSYSSLGELLHDKLDISIKKPNSYNKDNKKYKDVFDLPFNLASEMISEKACAIFKANKHFYLAAHRSTDIIPIYMRYELPLIKVLSEMETQGVHINIEHLKRAGSDFSARMQAINQALTRMYGEPINIDSPAQVADLLFNKLSLPVLGKTGSGAPATSEPVLTALSSNHEAPALIMEYRSLSKLKSTYVDSLLKKINQSTGCVHSSFNQAVTGTGRLSSSDPNLQNIPIRTKEGRRIRQAFIPSEGNVLVSADYSQIELRILAHLSGDKNLISAFNTGADIHKATAADVFGIHISKVTPEQRRSAKAINFGIIYGMSSYGLSEELGISKGDAQKFINIYFSKYPQVEAYLAGLKQAGLNDGCVRTISGRKIHMNKATGHNSSEESYIERAAMNAPMQGTAAEIIKLSMIKIHDWLISENMKTKMILQIHDELVFDSPLNEVKKVKDAVAKIMSQSMNLLVPLVIDIDVGSNLDQSHGLEIKENNEGLAM